MRQFISNSEKNGKDKNDKLTQSICKQIRSCVALFLCDTRATRCD